MKKKASLIINITIILISIMFTYAIVRATAENSCLEIKEQYFDFTTEMLAKRLETGIMAGLDIDNYSGIDAIAENAAMYDKEHIKAVILNESGEPVATNFDVTAEDLAPVFGIEHKDSAEFADVNGTRVFSQLFKTEKGYGHIVLMYDKAYFSYIDTFHLISGYKSTVKNISSLALDNIVSDISSLHDKGLKAEDILAMEDYFNERISDLGLIDSIELGFDTEGISAFEVPEGHFNVNMNISSEYVNRTYFRLFFTILAAFISCIMIIIEFLPIRKIIKSETADINALDQYFPVFIRFISFFVYLAVYTSLPYGAIIINSKGESILGLPVSVCASLPVTLEAIALLAMLSVSPVIFNKTGIKKYTLIIGLCTVIPSFLCFAFSNIYTIIICSVFLGITQGLLKHLMNYLISICSYNAEDISLNYGQFNIGTLTGITIGGSLGSIIAANKGYTAVYAASAVIMLAITVTALIFMPYGYIRNIHNSGSSKKQYSYSAFLKLLIRSPLLLINMVFSVGVVAIALMYIIAFMPVALDAKGLSPMISTYGFLIYGIAGNYISGHMLIKAKKLNRRYAAFIAMLIIAGAVLVIIPDINAVTIFTASFLAGLFDGYGAPSVTSVLLNMKKVKNIDSSLILTGTGLISGLGNAVAPVIYSTILYSGNISINLCLLFVFFLFSGIFILNMKE